MSLFRNTADLKLFADVHKQTDWSTLKLYVEQAEVTYIIPVVSEAMYNTYHGLMNNPANASKTFDQIFTNPFDLEAFKRIGKALANYSMFEAFPFLNTVVGDAGIGQQSSKEGTFNPASQWRYVDRRLAHLDNADRFTDQLLEYLEMHKDYFTDWAASTSFTINKDLFIATSIKLSQYIGTNNSRRAFLALRPHIRMAEKKYIIPAISQDLYTELKSQLTTNPSTVSSVNLVLLPMIEEALAWAAYYEGLPFLPVKFGTDGVHILSSNDGITQKVAASKEDKENARGTAAHNMDMFFNDLKKYMDDHADDYPLYKSSDRYQQCGKSYQRPQNHKRSGMFRV